MSKGIIKFTFDEPLNIERVEIPKKKGSRVSKKSIEAVGPTRTFKYTGNDGSECKGEHSDVLMASFVEAKFDEPNQKVTSIEFQSKDFLMDTPINGATCVGIGCNCGVIYQYDFSYDANGTIYSEVHLDVDKKIEGIKLGEYYSITFN